MDRPAGLVTLPTEILDMIIDLHVPDKWTTTCDGPRCLGLRLVCKLLDKLVSYIAFQKFRRSNPDCTALSRRINNDTAAWVYATGIVADGLTRPGGVLSLRDLWNASSYCSTPIREDKWFNCACRVIVGFKGRLWVLQHLNRSPRNPSPYAHPPPDDTEPDSPETVIERMVAVKGGLQVASYYGDPSLVRLLLASGASPNAIHGKFGCAIYAAAISGHTDILQLLAYRQGIDLLNSGYYGTPLEAATRRGHADVMKLLLARAAATGVTHNTGRCLRIASRYGDEQAIAVLLLAQPPPDVNAANTDGLTPLHIAVKNNHTRAARLLLERPDVRPNIQRYSGKPHLGPSPLWTASAEGRTEMVRLLLARPDTDPNLDDRYRLTPLTVATMNGHEEIVRLLIERDDVQPNLGEGIRCPLWRATVNGHEAILDLLLQRYEVGAHVKRLLGPAVNTGRLMVVRLLLARDDVDSNYSFGPTAHTPLYAAISHGYVALAELLLAHPGIDPNRAHKSPTPLENAVRRGNPSMVRALLVHPKIKPKKGRPLLPIARTQDRWGTPADREEIVKLLEQHGAL
ncbi:ankyrin repeat-containing domain protein [Podospora didyma]|uniref:Ankyrin repeat-containing domain protein n=1 Tax=Podospora didyma TaxID=330526 RepID=A0AAE0K2P8_9PEZI|nr:ankyrin repeat-containing domain protein [Podospora didyma]